MAFPGEAVDLVTQDNTAKGFPGAIVDLAIETPAEVSQPGVPPETGIADIFTGAERIAATPELGTLPRFLATPEMFSNFKAGLGVLSTFDVKAQKEIIKDSFPEAVFETTPDGSTIIEVPIEGGGTRRSVLNRPGFSKTDVTTALGQIIAFIPAARIAKFGKSLATKAAFGGTAAVGTEAALQGGGIALAGRKDPNLGDLALAGAGGVVGEVVSGGLKALGPRTRLAKEIDVEEVDLDRAIETIRPAIEAQQAIEASTGVNVGLFKAQQTLQPSTLLKQRFLPQLDASSRKAARELEAQNKDVFEATSRLINTIAPAGVLETGAIRFRTAAQKAVESKIQSRKSLTSPLYKEAFKEGVDVNLTTVKELIDGILKKSPPGGPFQLMAKKLKRKVSGNSDLETLQIVKQEMQDIIENFGTDSVSPGLKREVNIVKRELAEKMRDANPLYAIADDEFARLSPAIQKLDESIIGIVAKFDDIQLEGLAQKIFKAKGTDPSIIRNTKKIINAADPGAWDDLQRIELQRRFGGIESFGVDTPAELVGDVPGQLLRNVFGGLESRRVLLAGMDDSQRSNFVYLHSLLKRASAGRAAGSPTEPFRQISEELRGVPGVLKNLIFKPFETAQKTGERVVYDANAAKLVDVLFNPKWTIFMDELTKLDPASKRAENLFRELINASQAVAVPTLKAQEAREE